MNQANIAKVATLANLIEIGKRAILNAPTDDFQIPEAPGATADFVAETFAAALGDAIRTQAISKGTV